MLTIGTFAERCGLPRSALRFYDECGLLRPVAVDDATGYRYYDGSQVRQAELIRRLRGTDMPVERVRAFLAADGTERRRLLDEHLAVVEEHLEGLRTAASDLLASLDEDDGESRVEAGRAGASCALGGAVVADAVAQVAPAAAAGGERIALGGVLVEVRDGSLRFVATDTYRLVVRDVPPESTGGGPFRSLVPAVALTARVEAFRAAARCELRASGEGGLVLDLDGTITTVPGITADFPDYEQILQGLLREHRGVLDRRALAVAVAEAGTGPVTLSVAASTLTLSGPAGSRVLRCEWDGPERTVTLNGVFLADAIDAQVGPDVILEISGGLEPVIVRSADAGTVSVLIMPIRTDVH